MCFALTRRLYSIIQRRKSPRNNDGDDVVAFYKNHSEYDKQFLEIHSTLKHLFKHLLKHFLIFEPF